MNGTMTHCPNPTCVVCGSHGTRVYENLADVTFGSGYAGSMSRCNDRSCATMWADPCPKPEIIAKFYDNYYTHGEQGAEEDNMQSAARSQPRGGGIKPLLRKVLAAVAGPPARFAPELRYLQGMKPGRLLDIGCGNGDFLVQAKAAGWQVFGQEFDATAAGIAGSKTGSEVRVGSLHDVAFDADSFDAVTMSNVFEHVPDPRETLAEIRRILKPNGTLVSLSPNPESHLHRKYGEHWRGLEIPRHLYLFPPGAKKALCAQAGFERIEIFSTLGAFGFMEHASAEIRAKDRPDLPSLTTTSRLERMGVFAATLAGREIGEWTVVVCRKPA